MDEYQGQLISEQLNRLKDSIESRLRRIEENQAHHIALETEKLNHLKSHIQTMSDTLKDHESRIRVVDDVVISYRANLTIIQAGQAALTLIAAALAAWLGGRR